jgi:hypothetical protein
MADEVRRDLTIVSVDTFWLFGSADLPAAFVRRTIIGASMAAAFARFRGGRL